MKRAYKWLSSVAAILLLLFLAGWTFSIYNTRKLQARNVVPAGAVEAGKVNDIDCRKFFTCLEEHSLGPVEYITSKFTGHDVVLVSEMHEQKETCEFICQLIAPVYRAGVRRVCLEILKSKNNEKIKELLNAGTYNQRLAVDLFRDSAWPLWGFKEYVDILRTVWEFNSRLPQGAQRIEVVGLDADWDGYDLLCGSLWRKPYAFVKVIGRDSHMAKIISREILEKGEKALVQIGYAHTFPRYRGPVVKGGKLVAEASPRFGYKLHEKYGERIFQVCMHQHQFSPEVFMDENYAGPIVQSDLIGLLERIFELNGNRPVGFDVQGSPFGNLRDEKIFYFAFQKYVLFSDIAQGYVFLKPLSELSKVSWIPGFIDDSNFEKAKAILLKKISKAEDRLEVEKCKTPEELDGVMSEVMK